MSSIFQVEWIVTPKIPPQPRLYCRGCGRVEAFKSSGKIRLNANGKRLDAWAIYKCIVCDSTWNQPIFERRNVNDIYPSVLRALQTNDGVLATKLAFDITQLRRFSNQIDEFPDVIVGKLVLSGAEAPYSHLGIRLRITLPVDLRVDRLLASEFVMSRTKIQQLEKQKCLTLAPERKDGLQRRVKDGMQILLDLSNNQDARQIIVRASPG
jgi:hypothetical protein